MNPYRLRIRWACMNLHAMARGILCAPMAESRVCDSQVNPSVSQLNQADDPRTKNVKFCGFPEIVMGPITITWTKSGLSAQS